MEKRNAGIDLLKLVFACLIPLLHIPFAEKGVVAFFEQYVARMGVPFFFAASGYLYPRIISAKKARCHPSGKNGYQRANK